MCRRDWGRDLVFALSAGTVFVFMVGVITAAILGQYAKVHETNAAYQQNAENDRRGSSEEIAETCGGREGSAFRTCIAETLETYYTEQATNKDLQAQQNMAFWAKWMMYVSAATAAVTAAGVWYVARTLEETRRANEIMGKAYLTDQRPWLSVNIRPKEPLRINDYSAGIEFNLSVKNIGKTPATLANIETKLVPSPNAADGNTLFDAHCAHAKRIGPYNIKVMPGDNPRLEISLMTDPPIIRGGVQTGVNGDYVTFLIFACITYTSLIDDDLHQTGLVFRISRGPSLYWFSVPNCEVAAKDLHIVPFTLARNIVT